MKNSKLEKDMLANSLERAAKFANNSNFITNIYKVPLYNDDPKIFAYSATYKLKYKNNEDVANGFSFFKNIALMRVLGEGVERYCLDHFSPKNTCFCKESEVKTYHLNPLKIIAFSSKQLKNNNFNKFRIDDTSLFGWTKGVSLTKKKDVLVPSQLVIFNYVTLKNEPRILSSISTGAASGLSLEDALYRAICEIVERDAFMISYLNKLNSPRLDLLSIGDPAINKILNTYARYKLELAVIDITTNLQIPAFVAITLDRTGIGPATSVGLKAGFNIKDAIIGAIEESLMTRSWQRDNHTYNNLRERKQKKEILQELTEKACFWFSIDKIKHLDFWLNNKNVKKINIKKYKYSNSNLKKAVQKLTAKKMEIIYVDITTDKIKQYGFTTVKVIIPGLHPLHLDEKHPYWGGERLYNAPIEMGLLKTTKHENELNKIPHPFL